jgi:hypothetical protein
MGMDMDMEIWVYILVAASVFFLRISFQVIWIWRRAQLLLTTGSIL